MRLLSSLLIAALGGFVGAAPAAPLHAGPARDADEPVENAHGEIGRVVLRGDSHRPVVPQSPDCQTAPTLDRTPALRVRRLPPAASYNAPVRDVRAQARAGLLATPPPPRA